MATGKEEAGGNFRLAEGFALALGHTDLSRVELGLAARSSFSFSLSFVGRAHVLDGARGGG